MSKEHRKKLAESRRLIIKVGSKSLTSDAFDRLAEDIAHVRQRASVVVVSSGAIALGVTRLGLKSRPKDMPWLQAAAAAGQSSLMQRWEAALSKHAIVAAQVLLTHADLADRTRTNNARGALSALMEAGAVPIINENDAVSIEEIKFGDNDQLASMVVPLCDADALLLLSDVDGLLNDHGERVPFVRNTAEVKRFAGASRSGVGTGGMASKLEAARRATLAGADVVIAPARLPQVIRRVIAGEDIGTLFPGDDVRLSARKHWIAFTLRPRGALILDRGAADAVTRKNRSILAVGVLGVRGQFVVGDSVAILDSSGEEIGRGLARLSASEAARVAHRKPSEGEDSETLVHRDDLVVFAAS
jgi:glutamate 5-kinase